MSIEIPTREDFERLADEVRALRQVVEAATIAPKEQWVSIAEAARREGVHPDTIRRRIGDGTLKTRGAGKLLAATAAFCAHQLCSLSLLGVFRLMQVGHL